MWRYMESKRPSVFVPTIEEGVKRVSTVFVVYTYVLTVTSHDNMYTGLVAAFFNHLTHTPPCNKPILMIILEFVYYCTGTWLLEVHLDTFYGLSQYNFSLYLFVVLVYPFHV